MKWLVLMMLLALAPRADAKVIIVRDLSRACPGHKDWKTLTKCFARYGKASTLRSTATYRLIQLDASEDEPSFSGIYLYTLGGGSWRVGGMYKDDHLRFVGLERLKVGKRSVFRIDVSSVHEDEVGTSTTVKRPAQVKLHQALFCAGDSTWCERVVVACDVFVGGKALWTFRGKLSYDGNDVVIDGDRSKAGTVCLESPSVTLPTPLGDDLQ